MSPLSFFIYFSSSHSPSLSHSSPSIFPSIFHLSHLSPFTRLEHEGITRERKGRVAALLNHVEESDTVYRVASQLGLKGSIDACLASPAAPYLKDTVFVQGCTAAQL